MPGFINENVKHFLNCSSELFNEAPTLLFKNEVSRVCLKLENYIQNKLTEHYGSRVYLNYGTEFEITLLHKKSIDSAHKALIEDEKETKPNPSFSHRHKQNIENFVNDIETAAKGNKEKKDLLDFVSGAVTTAGGSLTKEFRTEINTDSEEYFSSVNKLGKLLNTGSKKHELFALVFSEHMHISFNQFDHESSRRNNITREKFETKENTKSLIDMQIRCLPFITLPDDIVENAAKEHNSTCFRFRNTFNTLEFKINSHSYAHDPYLNHLVRLTCIAGAVDNMIDGVKKTSNQDDIDKFKTKDGAEVSFSNSKFTDFCQISKNDPLLEKHWGKELLAKLIKVVSRYQDIYDSKASTKTLAMAAKRDATSLEIE